MGGRSRRRIRLGPLRFNLPKSGIGAFLGTLGFGIGKGAKNPKYQHASSTGRGVYERNYLKSIASPGQPHTIPRLFILIGIAIVIILLWTLITFFF
jgi:hypothetical protein